MIFFLANTFTILKQGDHQWKEGNVLFNDAFDTFYLWLFDVRHMVKDHSGTKRGNTLLPHRLFFPRDLLYAPSHRQDSTYHNLCYTSCGALAEMRNSSMGPLWGIDLMTHYTMSWCSTTELHLAPRDHQWHS